MSGSEVRIRNGPDGKEFVVPFPSYLPVLLLVVQADLSHRQRFKHLPEGGTAKLFPGLPPLLSKHERTRLHKEPYNNKGLVCLQGLGYTRRYVIVELFIG